jgi:hypothetical protein
VTQARHQLKKIGRKKIPKRAKNEDFQQLPSYHDGDAWD